MIKNIFSLTLIPLLLLAHYLTQHVAFLIIVGAICAFATATLFLSASVVGATRNKELRVAIAEKYSETKNKLALMLISAVLNVSYLAYFIYIESMFLAAIQVVFMVMILFFNVVAKSIAKEIEDERQKASLLGDSK